MRDEGELTVGELVARLDEAQPKVSNHLACLRWCGFVATRREHRAVYNRTADERVIAMLDLAQRCSPRTRSTSSPAGGSRSADGDVALQEASALKLLPRSSPRSRAVSACLRRRANAHLATIKEFLSGSMRRVQ